MYRQTTQPYVPNINITNIAFMNWSKQWIWTILHKNTNLWRTHRIQILKYSMSLNPTCLKIKISKWKLNVFNR